jgi:hypothetical protein
MDNKLKGIWKESVVALLYILSWRCLDDLRKARKVLSRDSWVSEPTSESETSRI